jgi:hypothetical protein
VSEEFEAAKQELREATAEWNAFRRRVPMGTDDLYQYEIRLRQQFQTAGNKDFDQMKARLLKARKRYLALKAAAG